MSPQARPVLTRLQHEIMVAYRTVGGFITDWAVNISRGGLFVNTRSPLEVGAQVRLLLSLPDGNAPFDLEGRVTWSQPPESGQAPGMGIEFLDVDAKKQARIESFVEKLRADFASSRVAFQSPSSWKPPRSKRSPSTPWPMAEPAWDGSAAK